VTHLSLLRHLFKEALHLLNRPPFLTQDILWIDGNTRGPVRRLLASGPAHPSRARLGRAPLVFNREALRASTRFCADHLLTFPS
jgi:hypothetical protein